jgi:pimeloyl-ACP methyl ester carboxylesterase
MASPVSILLPGLDGTGRLFQRFIAAAPAACAVQCLRLPEDRPRGYPELAEWIHDQLPDKPVAIVAESFSGPLALLVANRCPYVVAVVLCASFMQPPLPAFLGNLPNFFWSRPPPAIILRLFLTGGDLALAQAVRHALSGTRPDVLAARIAAALSVDVTAQLRTLSQPLLCLSATHDRIIPATCTETIRAIKPAAHFAEIDAPHLLLQSCPSEAWRYIQPFLERTTRNVAG